MGDPQDRDGRAFVRAVWKGLTKRRQPGEVFADGADSSTRPVRRRKKPTPPQGGQPRGAQIGGEDVVEAHDADVLGHAHRALGEALHHTDGEQVVVGHDRRRVGVDCAVGGGRALGDLGREGTDPAGAEAGVFCQAACRADHRVAAIHELRGPAR